MASDFSELFLFVDSDDVSSGEDVRMIDELKRRPDFDATPLIQNAVAQRSQWGRVWSRATRQKLREKHEARFTMAREVKRDVPQRRH